MIDEKGRIFGKINLIDLLALLAAVAVAVLLAVRLAGNAAAEKPGETPEPTATPAIGTSLIEYTARATWMDPAEYAEIKKHFDAGERQCINADGTEAEGTQVVDIRTEPYLYSITDDDGTIHIEEDPYFVNVLFTLRSVTTNSEANAFHGQEARIGRNITIRTRYYEIVGLVLDCETLETYPPESGD